MVIAKGFITSLFLHRMLIALQTNDEATPAPLDILKQPVINKETIKIALREDRLRFDFLKSNGLRDSMRVYPYLQHADMVRKSKY